MVEEAVLYNGHMLHSSAGSGSIALQRTQSIPKHHPWAVAGAWAKYLLPKPKDALLKILGLSIVKNL